jgi:hypothetical protein
MQSIADHIRRDVEDTLQKSFQTFDVLEHTLPNDENAYYKMKIKVDNNGHVKVKTAQKEPGKEWDVHVEEYERGSHSALEQDKTTQANKAREQDNKTSHDTQMSLENDNTNTNNNKSTLANRDANTRSFETPNRRGYELSRRGVSFFDGIQTIADRIKQDVEHRLNRTFEMFDVLDHSTWTDPDHTFYNMRIRVDDNGHVKVKTARKEPGKDWDVHIEEYDRGNDTRALDNSQKREGMTSIEQEKQDDVQIDDETNRNTKGGNQNMEASAGQA